MNLPIKYQLSQIVTQLAYKAFGFNIKMNLSQVQLIPNTSLSDKISFKIPIPQLIYQEYSKDGFMYSDPGITPKKIADDILIHFKALNHVQMESDQFGNIKAVVKDQYFDHKYEQMIKNNKIECLECTELKIHEKASVCKANHLQEQSSKHLFVLFRQKQQSIRLSQFRQKLVFEVIQTISSQVFLNRTQLIELFDQDSSIKIKFPTFSNENYTKIYFACLKHQIIKKELQLCKFLSVENKKETNEKFNPFKFGIVLPENIQIKFPSHNLSDQQISKMRSIFYDNSIERPINFPHIKSTDFQFKNKLERKILNLPLNLAQLLFKTEQMLSDFQVTQLYHHYLILSHFLNNQNSKNQSGYQSNFLKLRYKNAAKIIKDYLGNILFKHESL